MDTQDSTNVTPEAAETAATEATETAATEAAETGATEAAAAGQAASEQELEEQPAASVQGGIHVEEIDDFAAVLAEFEQGANSVKEGDVVVGTVLKVLEKDVIVDIGYKSEGIIDLDEFRRVSGELQVEIGDKVDVFLEKSEDADGYVVLSKEKAERLKVWDTVETAFETGEPIEGRVVDRIKGGLKVDIGLPAFLPGSLVDVRPVRNLESLINQTYRMKVIKVNKRRGNIVLSRKAILEVENAEKKTKTLTELEEGKILRGVVKNLTEYGAFIDLGGIDGLLHITDISWGRINHPSEKFQIGDELDVIVLKFDREKERVSLGFKQLQEDPWEDASVRYPQDSKISGKVVSLTDYGAFIEVEEGVEGLIHVSEMSWTKRVKHPSKMLNVGDPVECIILDIDQENRRLSLGLKQTEPNPWDVINTRYRVGDRITGVVRNITDFGAFVEVEEGIDGLVHISDLSWTKRIKHPSEVLNKGDEVEAVILKIDSDSQRLSLGVKQTQQNVVEDFFGSHGVGDVLTGKIARLTDFGAFVQLFEGVEGLVHVSELAAEPVPNPETAFAIDQDVRVKIIKIDPEDQKIGLSIKAALNEPDTESVTSYFESQASQDGGATLGDLMSATLFRAPDADEESPAVPDAPAVSETTDGPETTDESEATDRPEAADSPEASDGEDEAKASDDSKDS